MTRILFITPYYPPEKSAPAIRISETAQCLVKHGYQVTVLTTFPNFPSGIVPQEYRGHLIQREVRGGVSIVRVWSYITPNRGFLRRILGQLSFGCIAPLLGWKEVGRPDVIIVESPPLFDAIGARMLAWGKHCPFIFTVADLWPEAAIQMGVLRNQVLIRLAEWLEWSTYRRSSLVWVVSEGLRDLLIQRGLAQERIFLLTNGVDTTLFRPLPQAQARVELCLDERFIVLYAGTHGLAQGLETVLDAAQLLREQTDIHFVFAGDGETKSHLMTDARRYGLKNVTFLDFQPHDRLPLLLAAADVCLVPLRKVRLFEATLPVKMFEIMACDRPILLAADGIARRLAEQEAGTAIYVKPEDADALASAILYLYEHPEVAGTLGRRGRAFVEARFDREKLVETLESQITTLITKKIPGLELIEHPPVAAGMEKSKT
jgi:colanic acid biosynthesis glycosyl transferase WcaI